MIVVVASRHDPGALALVDRWRPHGAALLRCEDLSIRGWRFEVERPSDATAIVEGQAVPAAAIRGVVTRRPFVLAAELLHVAEANREYVAAEETAFLFAWLSSLSCPVLNRPAGSSLSGPYWRHARWMQQGRAAGFSLDDPGERGPRDAFDVHVVGRRCIGSADERANRPRVAPRAGGGRRLAPGVAGESSRRSSTRERGRDARPVQSGTARVRARLFSPRVAVVLLWGLPSDGPLAAVRGHLERSGERLLLLDQGAPQTTRIERPVDENARGVLQVNGQSMTWATSRPRTCVRTIRARSRPVSAARSRSTPAPRGHESRRGPS